jgi:hypothetical protein
VALLFVKFLHLDMLSRLVDGTLLALALTFLDLAVDDFPMLGCTVLAKAPFLELTLVLALAGDESGAHLSIDGSGFGTLTS